MPDFPWLFVSKSLRRPFRDGSTVFVRDLVRALPRHRRLCYFGDPRAALREEGDEVLAAPAMSYAPSLRGKLRVLGTLFDPRYRRLPLHLFFTPNPSNTRALAALRRLYPRRILVQNVMSGAGAEHYAEALESLDRVVVLSEWTRERLRGAGVPAGKLRRIYPGVQIEGVTGPEAVAGRRTLLYCGDLDLGVAARLSEIVRSLGQSDLEWSLVVACRPKSSEDALARARLREELAPWIHEGRLELLAEVEDMDALFRRACLQLFIADHVDKKVDLPLVLLEGLARGVGLLSLDFAPVSEIFACARQHGLEVGKACPEPEIAGEVRRVLGDVGCLRQWSVAARQLAKAEFSISTAARAYEELYREFEDEDEDLHR